MKVYEICCGGERFAAPVPVLDTFFTRLRGLMFRRALTPWEGALLVHCSAIHCCFMRFPIDAVYLDDDMNVIGVETLRPWRVGGRFPGARHVLELDAGRGDTLKPGMKLEQKEMPL